MKNSKIFLKFSLALAITTNVIALAIPIRANEASGTEIGNGQPVIDLAGEGIVLPKTVQGWTARIGDSYTELVAPRDMQTSVSTRLRIRFRVDEDDCTQNLNDLEKNGWERFYWEEMEGVRLERPTYANRNRVRTLEVKLIHEANKIIELVLTGNKQSKSFSSIYHWLTPAKPTNKKD